MNGHAESDGGRNKFAAVTAEELDIQGSLRGRGGGGERGEVFTL